MRTGPRRGFRWTPETIVYAITLWYRQHSRPPLSREWDQAGENHPSRQTVSRVPAAEHAADGLAGGVVLAGLVPFAGQRGPAVPAVPVRARVRDPRGPPA